MNMKVAEPVFRLSETGGRDEADWKRLISDTKAMRVISILKSGEYHASDIAVQVWPELSGKDRYRRLEDVLCKIVSWSDRLYGVPCEDEDRTGIYYSWYGVSGYSADKASHRKTGRTVNSGAKKDGYVRKNVYVDKGTLARLNALCDKGSYSRGQLIGDIVTMIVKKGYSKKSPIGTKEKVKMYVPEADYNQIREMQEWPLIVDAGINECIDFIESRL